MRLAGKRAHNDTKLLLMLGYNLMDAVKQAVIEVRALVVKSTNADKSFSPLLSISDSFPGREAPGKLYMYGLHSAHRWWEKKM